MLQAAVQVVPLTLPLQLLGHTLLDTDIGRPEQAAKQKKGGTQQLGRWRFRPLTRTQSKTASPTG
jgi:hypothetical protein